MFTFKNVANVERIKNLGISIGTSLFDCKSIIRSRRNLQLLESLRLRDGNDNGPRNDRRIISILNSSHTHFLNRKGKINTAMCKGCFQLSVTIGMDEIYRIPITRTCTP